jgi:hypothetical protein
MDRCLALVSAVAGLGQPRQVNTSSRHTVVPNCASNWCQLVFANCCPILLLLDAWLTENRPIESSALRCAAFRCALLRDAGRTSPLDPPFRHQGASQKQSILLSYLFRFAPVHFAQRNWNLTVRKSYSPGSQVPSHGQTGNYIEGQTTEIDLGSRR